MHVIASYCILLHLIASLCHETDDANQTLVLWSEYVRVRMSWEAKFGKAAHPPSGRSGNRPPGASWFNLRQSLDLCSTHVSYIYIIYIYIYTASYTTDKHFYIAFVYSTLLASIEYYRLCLSGLHGFGF